jgi:hypothetical protein
MTTKPQWQLIPLGERHLDGKVRSVALTVEQINRCEEEGDMEGLLRDNGMKPSRPVYFARTTDLFGEPAITYYQES